MMSCLTSYVLTVTFVCLLDKATAFPILVSKCNLVSYLKLIRVTKSDKMPGRGSSKTRKVHKSKKNNVKSMEIEENENDNHSADSVVMKRTATAVAKTKIKSKVCKVSHEKEENASSEELLDYDDDVMDTDESEKVHFVEGDNQVDFEVHNEESESPSDGEASTSEESDVEDGEVNESDLNHDYSESEEASTSTGSKGRTFKKKSKTGSERRSLEAKLDEVTSSLHWMQQLMKRKGLFDEEQVASADGKSERKRSKMCKNKAKQGEPTSESYSETTIYHEAVMPDDKVNKIQVDDEVSFKVPENNRNSTSSEDQIDTSDELLDVDKFIADCQEDARRRSHEVVDRDPDYRRHKLDGQNETDQSTQIIREAEASKAAMLATPGNYQSTCNRITINLELTGTKQQASEVDENYLVIRGNIDEVMRRKIINHKYIDFSKLLPKDRISCQEDGRMELVSKGGCTYFLPVSDHESAGSITNFGKWEQAFRAFSNIYNQAYPARSTELIQYNHLIYTAAQSFTWENVYRYDKEFRIHMSNYPNRNWGIILQQAWSVYLKDRVQRFEDKHSGPKRKEICKRFNKGKCTSGYKCNYDH